MDSMLYNHGLMEAHAATQASKVAALRDVQARVNGLTQRANAVFQGHGSNAAQALQVELNKAFDAVFETLGMHGQQIVRSSMTALETDLGVAAGFASL